MEQITKAYVYLWKRKIGTITLINNSYYFSYEKEFVINHGNIEPSPIMMPVSDREYTFDVDDIDTFKGLPGMLMDSLPDKFGTRLSDLWFMSDGKDINNINSIERLCFVGKRAMGALEYEPQIYGNDLKGITNVQLDKLVDLCNDIKNNKDVKDFENDRLKRLIRISTSAGGARAKAIVAYNKKTDSFKSGQMDAGEGYEYYLIKFGGINDNKDKDGPDSDYSTRLEYAYYLMAKDAKIDMMDSFLYQDGNNYHFMTKRFDRKVENGKMHKIHMQSFCALAHERFDITRLCSYLNIYIVMKKMNLPYSDVEKLFRRMVFNVMARNQDDHVKNFSFLMEKDGTWSLSPAYDMTYAYDPNGKYTRSHQTLINNKSENITLEDILITGNAMDIKKASMERIIKEVKVAILKFAEFGKQAKLPIEIIKEIESKLIIL